MESEKSHRGGPSREMSRKVAETLPAGVGGVGQLGEVGVDHSGLRDRDVHLLLRAVLERRSLSTLSLSLGVRPETGHDHLLLTEVHCQPPD